jgi:hypothetical protein
MVKRKCTRLEYELEQVVSIFKEMAGGPYYMDLIYEHLEDILLDVDMLSEQALWYEIYAEMLSDIPVEFIDI